MTLTPLLSAIETRTARIGVVGLGYVGLPLILRLAEAGFPVAGFAINRDLLTRLGRGQSPFNHIPDNRVAALASDNTVLTDDFSTARDLDAVLICLPTPLDRYRQPDLSYVVSSVEAIAPHLSPQTLVSLESTTWPGTTEEMLAPILRAQGLEPGRDIALVFSPEREDPGNKTFTIRQIPKVVGGLTPACLEAGTALYGTIVETVVPVSSTRAAELTKLLANIQRSVNIGLMNERKTIAHAMEIDIFEVIDAASTKPFGFTRYTPGPGLGGHCIPIDPFYLTWKAREYGIDTRFIELSGEVNRAMPEYVVGKLMDGLNRHGRALNGTRILILGVAYKKNVDDMRETPAAEIMEKIVGKGGQVAYSDPHVPKFPPMRNYRFELKSVKLDAVTLTSYDAVVLVTDHERFDYDLIKQNATLIIDARGRFRESADNIVKA